MALSTGHGMGEAETGWAPANIAGKVCRPVMGDLERDARPMNMDGLRQLPHPGYELVAPDARMA
ncbi:MAG: hypothetical protein ABSD38_09965 [Syntrophorhabdales bacterium]